MSDARSRAPQAGKGEQAQCTVRRGHNQDGLGRQLPKLRVWMIYLFCACKDDAQACNRVLTQFFCQVFCG